MLHLMLILHVRGPSMGILKCRVGEGPDARGKDTDYPEGRDPIAEVAAAERVSKVTKS